MKTIQQAINDKDIEALELILSNPDTKAGINNKDPVSGFTPLAIAAKLGYVDILKLLIENGAALNALSGPYKSNSTKPAFEVTALLLAVSGGHAECAKVLLEAGAFVDFINKDEYFKTALTMAAFKGFPECVNILLEHGAQIRVKIINDLLVTGYYPHADEYTALDAAIEGAKHHKGLLLSKPSTLKTYTIDKKGHEKCIDLLGQRIANEYADPQEQPKFNDLIKTMLGILLYVGEDSRKDLVEHLSYLFSSTNFPLAQLQEVNRIFFEYDHYAKEKLELRKELEEMICVAIEEVDDKKMDEIDVLNPHYAAKSENNLSIPLLPKRKQ